VTAPEGPPPPRPAARIIVKTLHNFVILFRGAGIPRAELASILLGAATAEARLAGFDINDVVAVIVDVWKERDAQGVPGGK
jgi:hypothetical protein